MIFGDYLRTKAGQMLVTKIDDHALFYLNAIFGEYLVADSTEGCHQPAHEKHTGVRIKAMPNSRGVVCVECHGSMMKKNSSG